MSITYATFRHVPHEGMAIFERILARAGVRYRYFDFFDDPSPEFHVSDFDGLIVMGGSMNVDEVEEYPFLQREVEWIAEAIAAKKPVLGVCLGAQLIAKALGAKIYPNPVKEIGWYPVTTSPAAKDDPVFHHFDETEIVFHWHGDTFDLPQGAIHLARSDRCVNQAYRFGKRVYALQFHIEVDEKMIRDWLSVPENREELKALAPTVNPEKIGAEIPQYISRLNQLADEALTAFCRL